MHHLIIGTLQERRIDRAERSHTLRGEARGEGHRVLLGNADIERSLRIGLGELVETGARRHRGGDRADRIVTRSLSHQRLRENTGIAGRPGRTLRLLAGDHIKLLHAVILVRRGFGRAIALALLRDDMD